MANSELRNTKDRKRAYRFRTCIGKDASGKRIFETTTWKPPEGLTAAKEKRLAETEAYRWEQQVKGGISPIEQRAFTVPPAAAEPLPMEEVIPEEETFCYFAEQVWLPLKVVAGGLRPSTIAMYGFMMRVSLGLLTVLFRITVLLFEFGPMIKLYKAKTRRFTASGFFVK